MNMNIEKIERSELEQTAYQIGALISILGGASIIFNRAVHLNHEIFAASLDKVETITDCGIGAAGFLFGSKLFTDFCKAQHYKNGPQSSVLQNFKNWSRAEKISGALFLGGAVYLGVYANDLQTMVQEDRIEAARILTLPRLDPDTPITVSARDAECTDASKTDKKVISVWYKDPGATKVTEHQLKCG